MANLKTGFDYYSVDTKRYLDQRIKKLRNEYGCEGIAVYDYILSEIYRDKGCYVILTEDHIFDIHDYWRIEENSVRMIVLFCKQIGLFYPFSPSENMITSTSIVKRYVYMTKLAKRKKIIIPEELYIIPEVKQIIQEEYNDDSVIIQQNKTKQLYNTRIRTFFRNYPRR